MNSTLPWGIEKSTARDALRLALQSAVAATLTYIIMNYFKIPEVFLGILSAVLIVSPSIGDTFDQAKGRVLSTLLGCLSGFLFVSFIPWGVGTAVSLGIIMFLMNGIAGFKPDWRYGVVGALAITLGSESDALSTSLDRSISILLGVVIGVVVSFTVWPDRAENRALRYLRKALTAASERFDIAIQNTRKEENIDSSEIQGNYHKNIDLAEQAAQSIRFKDSSKVEEQIASAKKLYNSILIIHRVAEQSESDVTDGEAGIEKDSIELKELACELTKSLASNSSIDADKLSKLTTLAETVKDNVQNSEDDKRVNALRYTFVFGMFEIKDSIEALANSFKKEASSN